MNVIAILQYTFAAIFLIGFVFKILHFPYGNLMVIVGMSCGLIMWFVEARSNRKKPDSQEEKSNSREDDDYPSGDLF